MTFEKDGKSYKKSYNQKGDAVRCVRVDAEGEEVEVLYDRSPKKATKKEEKKESKPEAPKEDKKSK